jgi:hypothetical protein
MRGILTIVAITRASNTNTTSAITIAIESEALKSCQQPYRARYAIQEKAVPEG